MTADSICVLIYLKEESGKDKRFDPQPFKNYSKRKNKTFNSVHVLKNRIKFKNQIDKNDFTPNYFIYNI